MMPPVRHSVMESGGTGEFNGGTNIFRQASAPPQSPASEVHPAGPTVFLNAGVAFDHLQRIGVAEDGLSIRISALPQEGRLGTLAEISRICRETGAAIVITNHWGMEDAADALMQDGLMAHIHPDRIAPVAAGGLVERIGTWLAAHNNPPHVVIEREKPEGATAPWFVVMAARPLTAPMADSVIEALTRA